MRCGILIIARTVFDGTHYKLLAEWAIACAKSNEELKMNKKIKAVVWYATVLALVFAARMLDHIVTGWFPINAALITLTVVYACIFIRPSWINALACGAIFGIMSLITSVMFPGAFTPYFVNPLVSILPRMIVGVAAYSVYALIMKAGKKFVVLAIAAACVVGSLVNTFTVMTMIFFFMRVANDVTYGYVLGLVMTLNTLFEVIIPPVLTPVVAIGVRKALHYDEEAQA